MLPILLGPALSSSRPKSVAVGANHVALGEFLLQPGHRHAPPNERCDALVLHPTLRHMIKVHAGQRVSALAVGARRILELVHVLAVPLLVALQPVVHARARVLVA